MRPGQTVLIVDDEPDLRNCLAELLQSEGFAVELAKNGQDALRSLESNPAIDLILLDYMMPVMDAAGFRTRQLDSPRYARIPTILLTAASVDMQVLQNLGPNAILKKPIDIDLLLSEVRRQVAS